MQGNGDDAQRSWASRLAMKLMCIKDPNSRSIVLYIVVCSLLPLWWFRLVLHCRALTCRLGGCSVAVAAHRGVADGDGNDWSIEYGGGAGLPPTPTRINRGLSVVGSNSRPVQVHNRTQPLWSLVAGCSSRDAAMFHLTPGCGVFAVPTTGFVYERRNSSRVALLSILGCGHMWAS